MGKELCFVKLPNFLSVDCKPFDPETYEDEIEDEENPDEEGRNHKIWFYSYISIYMDAKRCFFYYVISLMHYLGRERLKLKVENTIRWRQSFDSEGKAYKESNTRMVRYAK